MEERERKRPDDEPLRGELRPPGPVRFEITQTHRPGAVWLQIRGELDVLTVPRLAAEFNTLVRQSTEDVIVDLRQAEFVDSAGLEFLLRIQRRLSQASRKLTVVCEPGGPVKRVIEVARLDEALGLTTEDADEPGHGVNGL